MTRKRVTIIDRGMRRAPSKPRVWERHILNLAGTLAIQSKIFVIFVDFSILRDKYALVYATLSFFWISSNWRFPIYTIESDTLTESWYKQQEKKKTKIWPIMNKTVVICNVRRYVSISVWLGTILPIIYDILPAFLAAAVYSRAKNTQIPCKPLLAESKLCVCYLTL